ncbi:recombinase family protein [Kitasatospora saccharophila]|uniref:recombinase family protein n=1 Tax=Kitasatospora saccharophila TaxID=407973 RepID=UPI003643C8F8
MAAREEVISKLRGVPADLPPLAEVLAMLEANPGMKCVICYARISDDARAKDAHGIEDQHRELSDKAREFGWLMVHRYTDNDKSASKENVIRDDFEQMLVDLAAGKTAGGYPVHGVMAVNDDRLYRRPGDWERYLRAFTAHEGRCTGTPTGSRTSTPKASRSRASSESRCRSLKPGRSSAGREPVTATARFGASPSLPGGRSAGRMTRSLFGRLKQRRSARLCTT